ncbi:MAG: hypothetical protein HWN65_14240 [Candidatus Helarchaeota archaeon]|nr:hypothetical protein [Candidatus Helarchaeota archaeon]
MSEDLKSTDEGPKKPDKFLIGPGFGLFLMGLIYLVWWLIFSVEYIFGPMGDVRWAHNWAYAIIIMTVGAAWYHKSVISRTIAVVQAFMLPVTASGSFDTFIMTYITIGIGAAWGITVALERMRGKMFLQERLQRRTWLWICMHTVVVSWILIAHMGLVFFLGRVPFENQLIGLGPYVGFLAHLPPELTELATWTFDITLIIWALIVLYDQFKLGYNVKNKPWPRRSFWMVLVCMGSSLIALWIQAAIFGI